MKFFETFHETDLGGFFDRVLAWFVSWFDGRQPVGFRKRDHLSERKPKIHCFSHMKNPEQVPIFQNTWRFQVIFFAKHAILICGSISIPWLNQCCNKLNKYHLQNTSESKICLSLTETQFFGNPIGSTLRYVRTGIPHSKPPHQPTKQDIAELVGNEKWTRSSSLKVQMKIQ